MNTYEVEELAIAVLGLPKDSEFDYIEEVMYNRFECSVEQFAKIADALIPFTIPGTSALTGDLFQGFVEGDVFICKQKVRN